MGKFYLLQPSYLTTYPLSLHTQFSSEIFSHYTPSSRKPSFNFVFNYSYLVIFGYTSHLYTSFLAKAQVLHFSRSWYYIFVTIYPIVKETVKFCTFLKLLISTLVSFDKQNILLLKNQL